MAGSLTHCQAQAIINPIDMYNYLELQRLQNILVSASRYGAEEAVRTMGLAPEWLTKAEAIKRVGRPAFERALKNRTIIPAYADGSTRAVYPASQVNALYSALDLAAIMDTKKDPLPGAKATIVTGLFTGKKGTGIPSNPNSKANKNAGKI